MYVRNRAGVIIGEGSRFDLRRQRRNGSTIARQQKKLIKLGRRLLKQARAEAA